MKNDSREQTIYKQVAGHVVLSVRRNIACTSIPLPAAFAGCLMFPAEQTLLQTLHVGPRKTALLMSEGP